MDRNLKILMIFLILMFIYDLFCRKNIEGFTKKNFVYYSEGSPAPDYIPNRDLMNNASVNSFTYENVSGTDELSSTILKAKDKIKNIFTDVSYKLDDINSYESDPWYYSDFLNTKSDTENLCQTEYPKWNDDHDRYDIIDENGNKVNLYDQCIKDGLPYKKTLCLLPDRGNPRGTKNGSNVYKSYYMWDVFPNKSDGGMCTYTPPSVLTTGQYCSAHTDKDVCLSGKTKDGENHCNWIPSFRSYPSPTEEHERICKAQNNQGLDKSANKKKCENVEDASGFKPCKFTENTLIVKSSDEDGVQSGSEDESGTCEVDMKKYIGGLNLDEVRFYSADGDVTVEKSYNGRLIVNVDSVDDKSNLYRYINSGKCMENCSVSSASECNNRFSCVWNDNIMPKDGFKSYKETDNLKGSCTNKEFYYNMKDKNDPTLLAEIYDHTKVCSNYNSSETCNAGRLTDDTWHCKWKYFMGMCDQIGVKHTKDDTDNPDDPGNVEFTSKDGNYITKPEALSCQTLLANHVISKMDSEDAKNPMKQFEYIADPKNQDELENFCNKYRYESASLSKSAGYDSASNTPGAQFCLWKPPRDPECLYKSATDLVNPGEYYSNDSSGNQPFGQFTYQEPAFYYNNIFPPMCSKVNDGKKATNASQCMDKASRNCSWVEEECKPRCIRVGSNNSLCGKSVLDQYNQAVEDNKYSSDPDPMFAEDADKTTKDKAMERFDDYKHCHFNEELNTCVLKEDYDNWIKGGPWSSEIETQKWT